jgi:acetyltransferase
MQHQLDKLFKPESLIVIGDFSGGAAPGYQLVHNLVQAGYRDQVYAVALGGITPTTEVVYANVAEVPVKVDLALIGVPAPACFAQIEACGKAGIGGIAVLSSPAFSEITIDREDHQKILALCRKYNMRLLGPNSIGFMHPSQRLNASFSYKMALPGNLALISQSGALLTSILDWSVAQQVGFSYVVGLGSGADVDIADLIDYLGSDTQTSCVLIYLENLKNARRFLSAARAFSRYKPIIVLKAGRSEEGSAAALSHTGSMAGNDAGYEAAFRRSGIIRVDTIAQLFNIAQALALQPRPRGTHLAILTNGGGPGILATDYLIRNGGQLSKFSERTIHQLEEQRFQKKRPDNPIDLHGDIAPAEYALIIQTCLRDENVDGLLVVLSPQNMEQSNALAQALIQGKARANKPVFAVWMGETEVQAGRKILEQGRIPHYRFPESAVDTFLRIAQYVKDLELLYETPPAAPTDFKPNQQRARAIIDQARHSNRLVLHQAEVMELLSCYGIPVNRSELCKEESIAVQTANSLGYPVVVKIAATGIGHKTDIGGVIMPVNDEQGVKQAYQKIMQNVQLLQPQAKVEGVWVEKMVHKPFELLIGAKKDPVFGPMIVFGRGGVAVEVYRDTNAGLPPLNMALAQRIIEGTQIYTLLKGFRGIPGANLRELDFLLCKFAYLMMDFPEIKELEINPLMADLQGVMVVDALAVLDNTQLVAGHPYAHLVISPYPGQKYTQKVVTKKEVEVFFRPIRPEDEPALGRMLQKVSNDSLYMRFFGFIPKITHAWMIRFTHIDYDREMAIVAEINQGAGREMVGVVRIIEDAWRENAEYSILLADYFQGQGLGSLLTDYIIGIAKERKIKKIVASVLAANASMIRLFEKRGFTFHKEEHDIYEVELELGK